MKKNIKSIFIAILIIGIIIFAIYSVIKSKIDEVSSFDSSYADFVFSTYTVKRDNVESYIKSTGTITSFNIETLEIDNGDQITEFLVQEGQVVEAKQDILKVRKDDGTTKTIKSTISGMFFCVENQLSGTSYCIYNLDDIGVKIALAEKDITSINIGQKAKVNISALNKEFEGEVSYVSSLPQNDKFIVRVKLNYTDEIKFGYTTTTSILTLQKDNIISIPYDYVSMTDDGRYYVYKEDVKSQLFNAIYMEDGTSEEDLRTYISVGSITSKNVEVVEGLEEGEKIVITDGDY